MTATPDVHSFVARLTPLLDGVPVGDAISGLTSALMLVVLASTEDEAAQNGIIAGIVGVLTTKMADARIVAKTGHLPN